MIPESPFSFREANIEAALRSLDGVVSEIVFVDSCSMDVTCKIARLTTSPAPIKKSFSVGYSLLRVSAGLAREARSV